MDSRWKSNIEIAPNCPRCASSNTKFCYYNNYSLSQPRYFCKACRRYWTKGGSLRNVPFGGGCRKNRRVKSVRAPHRGSSSLSDSDGSDTLGNSGISNTSPQTNGSDIDLAVVFSNFLNQESCSNPGTSVPSLQNEVEDPSFNNFSNSTILNYDHLLQEENMDVIPDIQHVQLEEVLLPEFDPSKEQEQERIPQLVDLEPNVYGLHALLNDELWSETPTVPNFSWQQAQVQGWEHFQDDHSMFHLNVLHGNWNSLDIPSYGT